MRHRFVPDQHEAIAFRENLEWLADAWTDLLDRLGRSMPPVDGQPRAKTRAVGLVIDERVSELMRAVTAFAWDLANLLAAETADFRLPADRETPSVLLAVARRVGHFTAHASEEIRSTTPERAAELRREVTRAAYPDGTRTIHLPDYGCLERISTDDGRSIACSGHWTIRPLPSGSLGDMVCSIDPCHRVPPFEWMRLVRRRRRLADAVDDLTRVLTRARR